MPLDFPSAPTLDQLYSSGGRTWRWDGSVWRLQSGPAVPSFMSTALLAELASGDTPPAGYVALYAKADGKLYCKDDTGAEIELGAGGGGGGSGDALVANPLSQFAATTSAQLRGVLTDPTGTGAGVFADTPALTNPTIANYTEGVVAIGNSGTSQTLVLTAGTFQTVTLTGNCTFTMPTATAGKSFTLKIMSGAGGFTAAFTGVKWPSASAPVVTAAAGKYDLLTFVSDGTAWSGTIIPNFTA
jgi:hypothetical protein